MARFFFTTCIFGREKIKERALKRILFCTFFLGCRNCRCNCRRIIKKRRCLLIFHYSLLQGTKFVKIEETRECLFIWCLSFQAIKVKFNRNIGFYGCKEFTKHYLLPVLFNLCLESAFEFTRICKHIVNAAELGYQFLGSLFTYTGTTGYIIA
jgi:hypothetical protein